jgi:hypothetical protein
MNQNQNNSLEGSLFTGENPLMKPVEPVKPIATEKTKTTLTDNLSRNQVQALSDDKIQADGNATIFYVFSCFNNICNWPSGRTK